MATTTVALFWVAVRHEGEAWPLPAPPRGQQPLAVSLAVSVHEGLSVLRPSEGPAWFVRGEHVVIAEYAPMMSLLTRVSAPTSTLSLTLHGHAYTMRQTHVTALRLPQTAPDAHSYLLELRVRGALDSLHALPDLAAHIAQTPSPPRRLAHETAAGSGIDEARARLYAGALPQLHLPFVREGGKEGK